jgi:Type II CAAX prenyl endopeptidase Rce1-like
VYKVLLVVPVRRTCKQTQTAKITPNYATVHFRNVTMNLTKNFFLAHVNNAAPYVSAIPLLLTATTSTIYRIIFSARRKNRNFISGTKFVAFIFTYLIPCLLLFRNKRNDQMLKHDRIDAVYTAILWQPLTTFLSNWPLIIRLFDRRHPQQSKSTIGPTLLQPLVDGGPFGHGCSKIIQVLVAGILWKSVRGELPPTITDTVLFLQTSILSMQEMTNIANGIHVAIVALVLAVVSWAVTVILSLWLHYTQSKGDSHAGLNKMLQPTYGRRLQTSEYLRFAIMAFINAICEECTSRGFWRHELELTAGCSKVQSNILHGMIFGLWHYFGIPNGWTGVALTTLYGWVMGYLSDWNITVRTSFDGSGIISTGLLLPIITHSIADYYIFTVLARQSFKKIKF